MSYKLFKSTIGSCRYYFSNGSAAVFSVEGRFATAKENEIAELEAEVKAGHPHIYVDPKEATSETVEQDPMESLKKRIIEEYMQSNSVGIMNSATIAAGAAESSSKK
jgi:hypothetical protein